MNKKIIFSNLIIAFIAQGVSLILSFLISFILPKIMTVENFSFWQLFIFYVSYVGFFHFGINDGVYLRYGGLDFDEMNKQFISGQFKILLFLQIIIFIIGIIIFSIVNLPFDRKCVFFFTLLYMIVFNLSNFLGYIFQSANKTKWYSYSVIFDKISFVIFIAILILFHKNNYSIYILFYLLSKTLSLIYCFYKGKKLIFIKVNDYKLVINELKKTISSGIKLTFSAISSMLIIGIGRFFIDGHWGIKVFGKISFALSLTTFALSFISQVSMVFFPALRRMNRNSQKEVYSTMQNFCFFIMPIIYIIIIPIKIILMKWIPNYSDSLTYLSILLPICIFDAKMNMIFNTFFKVFRYEKLLLLINIFSLAISTLLCFLGTYVFDSYIIVLLAMVISIILRSSLSELILGKKMNALNIKKILFEILFAILFILISLNFSLLLSMIFVIFIYVLECLVFNKSAKKFLQICFNRNL